MPLNRVLFTWSRSSQPLSIKVMGYTGLYLCQSVFLHCSGVFQTCLHTKKTISACPKSISSKLDLLVDANLYAAEKPPIYSFSMASSRSLYALPTELSLEISNYLPHPDKLSLSSSCKHFRYMLRPSIFKHVAAHLFPHLELSGPGAKIICRSECKSRSLQLVDIIFQSESFIRQFIQQVTISVPPGRFGLDWRREDQRGFPQFTSYRMCRAVRILCKELENLQVLVIRAIPYYDGLLLMSRSVSLIEDVI